MAGRGGLALEDPSGQEEKKHHQKGQVKVPSFGGVAVGITLKQYKRKVKIWQAATEVPNAKQGVTLLSELFGKAESATENVDIDDLTDEDGASVLLGILSLKFPEVEVHDTAARLR